MSCIKSACMSTLPSKRVASYHEQYVIPGWNEIVNEKHTMARAAFMEWIYAGKPRQGPEFLAMQNTRSAFKLSLRYRRQHEQEIVADHLAKNMSDKHFDKFWDAIRNCNNSKSTVNAYVINGHTSDTAISEMWKNHYQALYNSDHDDGAKKEFLDRLSQLDKYSNTYVKMFMIYPCTAISKRKVKLSYQWKLLFMVELVYTYISPCGLTVL